MVVFSASLLILMCGLVFLSYGTNDPILVSYVPQGGYLPVVRVGEVPVRVYIADTPEEQQKGLSIFDTLPPGTGMFFKFDRDDAYGIWMKDMSFPIDIIWIDKSGRIVDIVQHATPESFPHVFMPRAAARYVLEVTSGFVEQRSISPADLVDFSDAR